MAFRMADWSLRTKMAALLVTVSLVPLGILAYLDLRQAQQQRLTSLQDLLQARGDQIVRELDAFHRRYQTSTERIAIFPNVTSYCAAGPLERSALAGHTAEILGAYPAGDAGIRGVGLLDGNGRVLLSTEPAMTGVDLSHQSHVRQALTSQHVVSDVFIGVPQSGDQPTIAYLTTLFRPDRSVACIVTLWVRAAELWRTVKSSDALAGEGSFAVLFDRLGIRIAHTSSDDIVFHPGGRLDAATVDALLAERRFGARTRALLEDVRDFPEQFERARADAPSREVFRGLAPFNQRWNYGVARRFATVPWTVFYMVPEAEVDAALAGLRREKLTFAAAVMAIAAAIGALFAARILRPIQALADAAGAIAGGDLSARVRARRGDELGRLGTSFDAMADQVQAQAVALQRTHDELEQRVRERTADLRDSELRFRQLAETIEDMFWVSSLDRQQVFYVSPAFERIWGRPRDAVYADPSAWFHTLHPDDRTRLEQASKAAPSEAPAAFSREFRIVRPDGVVRWVLNRGFPVLDEAGKPCRMAGVVSDITERKQQEASHQRLAAIIESSDDAIIGKTLAGIITEWNPGAVKLFGYDAAEALGQPMQMLIPPERSHEETEILARLARGETVDHFETVRVCKDGRRIDISATISPIRDGQGRVVGASKIARDITDRKHAQARLQAQLERLNLLDQITTAIGDRQDLKSIHQVVIRSVEERLPVDFGCMLGHDDAAGKLKVDCIGPHSQALAAAMSLSGEPDFEIDPNGLARCLRGELVYEPDTDGLAFPFPLRLAQAGLRSLVLAPLRSESRVFGILAVARRQTSAFSSGECEFLRQLGAHAGLATQQARLIAALQAANEELRQTQQAVMQQERLRALGQMASGIAHDINNAISPVLLYTETLLEREPGLSARARQYLQTISRAVDDVAATVARLREFYRQREPQLTMMPIDLSALMQQVIDLTRARWSDMPQQRGVMIHLRTALATDLPVVRGIDSEVREALINLVFNAVDAMPDGGVLTLRTARGPAPNEVLVEVADSGIGMDEDTRRRCLEPFFTTKGERGTGLGLAMVYGMAQRHGADIRIDSAVGQGTRIGIGFPLPTSTVQAPVPASAEAPSRRLRILLVDDDPTILMSLRDALELDGHTVASAEGGQAGIAIFNAALAGAEAFDVVVTDLGMPYVDGRQVALAVKRAGLGTPVIMLTGWGQRLIADQDAPDQVDRVLSKPPKLRELREALVQLTAARRQAGPADAAGDTP